MLTTLHRRRVLALGAATATVAALGLAPAPAQAATKNDAADLIKAFTGGKEATKGKVKLDLPEIAENGNTVPMTVSVDSPQTKDAYVQEVLVVAEGNPNAGVATFKFSPAAVPDANTRIRLAETQNVTAIAKMSDGSFFSDTKQVKVTIGGCGG